MPHTSTSSNTASRYLTSSVSPKRELQSPQPLHGITRLSDARLRRMSVCLSTAQRATLPTSPIKARPFTGSLSDLHIATLSQDVDDEEQEQFLARYFTSTTTSSSLAQKTGNQLSNYSMRKRGPSPHACRRTSTSLPCSVINSDVVQGSDTIRYLRFFINCEGSWTQHIKHHVQ